MLSRPWECQGNNYTARQFAKENALAGLCFSEFKVAYCGDLEVKFQTPPQLVFLHCSFKSCQGL
jgi:hypothetical protein